MNKLKIKATVIFFIVLLAGFALIKNPFLHTYPYRHVIILEPFRPRVTMLKHIDTLQNFKNAKP